MPQATVPVLKHCPETGRYRGRPRQPKEFKLLELCLWCRTTFGVPFAFVEDNGKEFVIFEKNPGQDIAVPFRENSWTNGHSTADPFTY